MMSHTNCETALELLQCENKIVASWREIGGPFHIVSKFDNGQDEIQ